MSKYRHLNIHACAEALAFVTIGVSAFPSSISPAFGGGSFVGFDTFPVYPCFPGCLLAPLSPLEAGIAATLGQRASQRQQVSRGPGCSWLPRV